MARCCRPCQFNNLHNFCLKFAMIQPVLQEGNLWNVTVDFCVIFFCSPGECSRIFIVYLVPSINIGYAQD